MMVQRVRFSPRKVMMGDASKETGKVPIGKNPSSVFRKSRLCQDDEIGNVSLVIRRRMKKVLSASDTIPDAFYNFVYNHVIVHSVRNLCITLK